jgi:hypothetical protein
VVGIERSNVYKDFLTPELEAGSFAGRQQAADPRRTVQEELDAEYATLLNKSDDRILRARGGAVPPSPFAPRARALPGSDAEYELLLSKCDPRLLWTKKGR